MASLVKDDVNDDVLNGTPKTIICFDGVVEASARLEGDQATHF